MSVKFLDLDAVDKPIGQFQLQGEKYDVFPMKLRGLINLSRLPETLEGQTDGGVDQLTQALDILSDIMPECPRETLNDLSMLQVSELLDWANALGEESVEKNSKPRRRAQRKLTSRS